MRVPRPNTALILRAAAAALLAAALIGAGAAGAGAAGPARASSPYPAGATRPALGPQARGRSASSRPKSRRVPALHGDPARALAAYEAMQRRYYIPGSGLYAGEPFSFLWPFSQAFAATVTLENVPALRSRLARDLKARLVGLRSYLDPDNSGAPEGTYTSSLPAYDGTVAPPAGPGGPKYFDDNDWVGLELVRAYKLTREPALLASAVQIMAFEMAGWEETPTLGCSGGIPFTNTFENSDRNTVTTAPAAELAVQLYFLTRNGAYMHFAIEAYEWVRRCLLQPSGLYGDHILPNGTVEPYIWSYNQGTMIGAGTMLFQATHIGAYLWEARQTARASLAYFTPERLGAEIPFFPSVYFRNLLYLDSITHDPPGPQAAQNYVNYAWQHERLSDDTFVAGSPASAQLLVQAAFVQIYGLLSTPPQTYF